MGETISGKGRRAAGKAVGGEAPSVLALGIGEAGCNSVSRARDFLPEGVETVAVDTDANELLEAEADRNILIGREVSNGLGAGADPDMGRRAAEEEREALEEATAGFDVAFLACGLGGGTGTGAAPLIAEILEESGALTVPVLTLPAEEEGEKRLENAEEGLSMVRNLSGTTVEVPIERLKGTGETETPDEARRLAHETVARTVGGIAEFLLMPNLAEVGLEEVRRVLGSGGAGAVGFGSTGMEERSVAAAEEALSDRTLFVDPEEAEGALISVAGGRDLSLDEAQTGVGRILEDVGTEGEVVWGAPVSGDNEGEIRLMLLLTGEGSVGPEGMSSSLDLKRV